MSGIGSSPALATCETSQVLLVGVPGCFPGVLPFRPTYRLARLYEWNNLERDIKLNKKTTKKLWYTSFLIFCLEYIDHGYSLESPHWPTIYLWSRSMKIYHKFSLENRSILNCSKNRSILQGRFNDEKHNDKEHMKRHVTRFTQMLCICEISMVYKLIMVTLKSTGVKQSWR